jgi:hypothetical protein
MLAYGAYPLCQNEEGRLERIFGILIVLKHAPADAVHHRAMALHDRLDGRGIARGDNLLHQLGVGDVRQHLRGHASGKVVKEGIQVNPCHVTAS